MAIKAEFAAKGYSLSEGALDRKWRNLKKCYSTIKDDLKRTGRGLTSWQYYDKMDDILMDVRTVNIPESTIATVTPSASTSTIPAQATPSSYRSPLKRRADKMSALSRMRKRRMEVNQERVDTLKGILEALKKSNEIQTKRNDILETRNYILSEMLKGQRKSNN